MQLSANMRPKTPINGRLIFSSKFVTFWGMIKGKAVQDQTWVWVLWGRGGQKFDFLCDIIFDWPTTTKIQS